MTKWKCTICGWIYDPAVGVKADGIEPGTRVRLECSLGGREWNGRYYLNLELTEITGIDRNSAPQNASAAPVENAAAPASKPAAKAKQGTLQPDDSDLPF